MVISATRFCEDLEKAVAAVYDHPMNAWQRIHRQKVQTRVRDLKAQARGRKLPKGLCLAKCVNPAVFKSPLNLKGVEVPTTYEED